MRYIAEGNEQRCLVLGLEAPFFRSSWGRLDSLPCSFTLYITWFSLFSFLSKLKKYATRRRNSSVIEYSYKIIKLGGSYCRSQAETEYYKQRQRQRHGFLVVFYFSASNSTSFPSLLLLSPFLFYFSFFFFFSSFFLFFWLLKYKGSGGPVPIYE